MSITDDIAKRDGGLRRTKYWLFTIVGLSVIAGSAAWAVQVWSFTAAASSAPGVVTRLNAGGSHPQVRFVTAAGEVVEYAQGGLIFGYRVGDEVRVHYDPRRPSEAVIDSFGARWGFVLLGVVMGAAFVGVAQLARRRPDLVR